MNLFETYPKEIVTGVFGTEVVEILEKDTCRKPFCEIVLDFAKGFTKQHATVVSTARLSDPSQKIYYLLKWNNPESAPGGNHLGQQNVDYSGRFVEDKDSLGRPITVPSESYDVYYDNNIFYFVDNIEQQNLTGIWTFMIVVTDAIGNVLCKKSIDLNWDSIS